MTIQEDQLTEQQDVTRSIKELIAAGTTFDIDALERIYHDEMQVITVNESGDVTVADKTAFKGLFEAKLAAGADPLNTWAQFNRVDVHGPLAHVLVTRTVNLGDEDQRLILSIDLRHEDGRWQVTREVIFARPDTDLADTAAAS